MECECKNLSTIKGSKNCKCNRCGRIWERKDGKWCVVQQEHEIGGKNG